MVWMKTLAGRCTPYSDLCGALNYPSIGNDIDHGDDDGSISSSTHREQQVLDVSRAAWVGRRCSQVAGLRSFGGDHWNPSHGWVDCVRGEDGGKGMEKGRGGGKEKVRLGLDGGRETRVGVGRWMDGWMHQSLTD